MIKEVIFRKDHDIPYREHSFCRLDIVKNELQKLSKKEIKKKLSDYKYRHLILKEIAFSNPSKFSKARDLEEYFILEYDNIKIQYNKLNSKDKEQIIKKYKNKETDIEKLITLNNECANIINNLKSYIRKIKIHSIEELLTNMELKSKRVSKVLNVNFKRFNN